MNTEQIIQEWERPIREECKNGENIGTAFKESFLYARLHGRLRAQCARLLCDNNALQRKADAYDELTRVLRQWADDADAETDEKIHEALERAHRVGYRKEVA